MKGFERKKQLLSIEDKEIIQPLEFWGAYDNKELKGVVATNDNRKHICCFFC